MKKVVIFGAGATGCEVYNRIHNDYNVLAFCDNNKEKQKTTLFNLPILDPVALNDIEYDFIFIGADSRDSIYRQIKTLGISHENLKDEPIKFAAYNARRMALRNAGDLINAKGLIGNVAEAGVFQGEFAKEINEVFCDRSLYLFDTFGGFDKRDVILEDKSVGALHNEFDIETSADYVLGIMPHKDKCIIKQGYFPESAAGIDDSFVFVSLDMDLYKPTLEGLIYFYPKLVKGGYIFIHDYFSIRFSGVEKAVSEYAKKYEINMCPLGDNSTLIVTK